VQRIIRNESAFDRGLFCRVTTNQVLHVARQLEGKNWTTKDLATHLDVNEQQVRASVSWLVNGSVNAETSNSESAVIQGNAGFQSAVTNEVTSQSMAVTGAM
jgi:23S rRNA pseudoU1915 N3-methylase RlmH